MLNEQKKDRNSDTPLVEVQSVSFTYNAKDSGRALNRVSFFIRRGERVAVLGHNGSGKSTLVRILGGLLTPSEGVCRVKGADIQELPSRELRRIVGMVFQDPENQIVAAMVDDDIAFAPENQGLPSGEIQTRVDSALDMSDMRHKQGVSVAELSGGEKQRLALAGALAADVECLILDEPTAMLDPAGRVKVEKVLRYLHSKNLTIIQVTHQIGAENFDDIERIIVLSHGSIVWQGVTGDFWGVAESLGFELPDALKFRKFCADKSINFPDDFMNINMPNQKSADTNTAKKAPAKFRIAGLSFRHNDKSYALRNINAEIFAGEWLSIIGRTGSGKSTLVQHLNGLYKSQDGQIFFEGFPLPQSGEGIHTLRQRVGLVFQHPEDQLFSPTVREELAFAPKNFGSKAVDDAVLYGLECAGLPREFLDRNPIALSGGERRLVAIASVLSAMPECVVLDEPLAGLDASYQRQILGMLGKLRDEGKTIITVTHDLDMALNFSDRILILRDGEFVREGRPNEILDIIMESLDSDAWPDVLRISAEIRKVNHNFPLFYNYEEMIACISRI